MTKTIIKGGRIFDSARKRFEPGDLLIESGKISHTAAVIDDADARILNADECYVSPGFFDLHCHIYAHPLFRSGRLSADRIGVRQGVTSLLDAGSAGATMIDAFEEFVIDTQATDCYTLVNIGSPGQPGIQGGHSARPELLSLPGAVAAIERHPDWILGVKVLASSSHTGMMGLEAVKMARKAAEIAGTPLMVHIGNAPPVIDDVLELLREGDILTHAYHGKTGGVLGFGDKVIDAFREAVARGIVVDIAHGRSSFAFDTCRKALDQGLPVHTISSDLHGGNVDRYVVSLARTMSKFRHLGMSLEDVIHAVTAAPAQAVRLDRQGLGNITEGAPANITVFRETDLCVKVEDAEGEQMETQHWIEPVHAIVNGEVFDVCEPL